MFETGSVVPSATLTVTQELLNQGCLDRRVEHYREKNRQPPGCTRLVWPVLAEELLCSVRSWILENGRLGT